MMMLDWQDGSKSREMCAIDIGEENGSASGYVVASRKEQICNFLSEYTEQAEAIAEWLKNNVKRMAVLKNISVDEAERGNGLGNNLLSRFLEEAEHELADGVLLISDQEEAQLNGFKLDQWYEGFGFVPVHQTNAGKLMVFPEELGEHLKAVLSQCEE